MPTIKDIAAAMAALAKALPGSTHVNVNLHNCTDDTVNALVAEGGELNIGTNDNGTETWSYAQLDVKGATIVAYGPHRRIAKLDESAAFEAMKQAARVLADA